MNRITDDGEPLCESERVTVYQALKMKTVDAAYVHGLDGLLGTIEAGKFADFTILDKSPLDVPVHELRNIKVLGTVVGGKKYPAEPRNPEFPQPPPGLVGPLFWLMGMTATSQRVQGLWFRLAALAGCDVTNTPPSRL